MLREKVEAEIATIDEALRKRGGLFDDEQAMHSAFSRVLQWINEDKIAADTIEREARAASERDAKQKPAYAPYPSKHRNER